jgi:class 3 adenylate cyclase
VDTAGDGFLAAFDRPAQAVRCAGAIVERVQDLGIDVWAGVHVGEAEVMGRKVGGMVVHTGARITQLADPGTVLVSETLKRLVPGARFGFEDRGVHRMKGVPEEHRVLAVPRSTATDCPARWHPRRPPGGGPGSLLHPSGAGWASRR